MSRSSRKAGTKSRYRHQKGKPYGGKAVRNYETKSNAPKKKKEQ
jgi:hypothetical protein